MTIALVKKTVANDSVPVPASAIQRNRQRVLVVEDETDIAALVAYQLTKEGYRVETASNGSDALTAIHREIPALVVLDRMLPGVGGDEVLRSLKSEAATRTVPV